MYSLSHAAQAANEEEEDNHRAGVFIAILSPHIAVTNYIPPRSMWRRSINGQRHFHVNRCGQGEAGM
jgi:hypothetical protein